jgi:4-amino-4-deoxy-L-arabinose transferase-like glycosyltransferase
MRSAPQQSNALLISLALVAILGLTLLLRMNFWDQPLQMDEGVYSYIGWGMFDGLVPYKDVFDHKPPGIYMLYAVAFLLLGPTALSVKVFGTIYTLGTVLAVFQVARKLAGNAAGCLAALLYAIFSTGPNIQGGSVNTEVFMVLPYTLAAYSFLKVVETGRRDGYFFAGLWTGLACTIKQVAVVNLLWVAGYLLVRMWRAKEWDLRARVVTDGLWVLVGAVLPWIPFVLYFYVKGALKEFYFWQVGFNLGYINIGYQNFPNFLIFLDRFREVLTENSLLWLFALAGIGWGRQELSIGLRRGQNAESSSSKPMAWALMATWPAFSLLGVALGGRFFEHYFIQMIPSLAVLGGVGLQVLIHKIRSLGVDVLKRPAVPILAGVFAWAFVAFIMTEGPYYFKYNGDQISYHQYKTPLFSVTRFIGKYLGERTQSDDLIYVWRWDPEINFYALRKSPSPYLIHWEQEETSYHITMECLRRAPPEYIVATFDLSIFPALEDYIRTNYQEETNDDLDELRRILSFRVYRRKAK